MNFFDLHCDTAFECYTKNQEFYVNQLGVSGKKGEIFENWTETFAIWIKDDAENPFSLYKTVIESFKQKLKDIPPNLNPIFAVEGGATIENDIDRLDILKRDGIRLLTLTWNGENWVAGGSKSQKGLTAFGKTVIKKMNRLRIGCDMSHLNSKSLYSAIELSDFPLASHSNCNAVCPHPRNLTDEQIKLICEKGGIIGLCFYPEFLKGDVKTKIYENICHIADMGFENAIAIGSDFDGGKMSPELDGIDKIPDLYRFLEQKGLKKCLLDKIFYKNADNYIAKLI